MSHIQLIRNVITTDFFCCILTKFFVCGFCFVYNYCDYFFIVLEEKKVLNKTTELVQLISIIPDQKDRSLEAGSQYNPVNIGQEDK